MLLQLMMMMMMNKTINKMKKMMKKTIKKTTKNITKKMVKKRMKKMMKKMMSRGCQWKGRFHWVTLNNIQKLRDPKWSPTQRRFLRCYTIGFMEHVELYLKIFARSSGLWFGRHSWDMLLPSFIRHSFGSYGSHRLWYQDSVPFIVQWREHGHWLWSQTYINKTSVSCPETKGFRGFYFQP